MGASGGGHPTDAQRAAEALPALNALLDGLRAGDGAALGGLLRDDVAWLAPDGAHHGPEAAMPRLLAVAARASRWEPPQQQGAKAALRWRAGDGGDGGGALVVEVRRGRIIFIAEA